MLFYFIKDGDVYKAQKAEKLQNTKFSNDREVIKTQKGRFGMKHNDLAIPMNLQFFAEGELATNESATPTDGDGVVENEPTREQLMEMLAESKAREAQAVAKSERYKNSIDDLTKKNGELTKQVREGMSAEEKSRAEREEEKAAQLERDKAKDEKIAELEAKEKIRDCTEYLMDKELGVAMDKKAAKDFAESFIEANFEKCMTILGNHIKAIRAEEQQKALDSRDPIHAGNGGGNDNALAEEMAKRSARRTGGVNVDILKQYGLGGN